MENSGLDISDEDIDARLARYAEDAHKVDDAQNNCQDQPFKEDISLHSLSNEEFKKVHGIKDYEKKVQYSPNPLISCDLNATKTSSKINDFKRNDKNDLTATKYGARPKNISRNSYQNEDTYKLQVSQYDWMHCDQNTSNASKCETNRRKVMKFQGDITNYYVSNYSRYNDFKHIKKKKLSSSEINKQYMLPKMDGENVRKMRNSGQYDYTNESDIGSFEQKGETRFNQKANKRHTNSELFHMPKKYNSEHSKCDTFKQIDKINPIFVVDYEIGNHSRANDFEIKSSQLENCSNCKIHETNLNDNHCKLELKHTEYENQIKYQELDSKNDIWKKQSACDDIDVVSSNLNDTIRNKNNTLTMHDAHKIAPIILKHPVDSDYDIQNIFQTTNEIDIKNKRKCWTRLCWSNTKHSHAVNISKGLNSWKSRSAIMNSMKSPHYAIQSKKKTFTDYWSSFLKASRFELWSRTLKKIEGQFGTGVVSYFVFLRWLIVLNFFIFILYFLLIILPYSAFALLPHQNIKSAPNSSLLTDEFIQQFPKDESISFTRKRISSENVSLNLNEDLLSNLGTLLDNYVPNEILDITLRHDKRNHTGKERERISIFCKDRYEKEMANHTTGTFSFLQDFLQGTGWLQSTILFLGFYPDRDVSYFGLTYNLPVSFLAVLIVSFFLSLVLMVQYSSHGIQESVLTQKSNYLTFSNMLFCSWDYCIEDKKMADIRHKSITCELKSNLAEEHRKSQVRDWSSEKKMKVCMLRVTINIIIIGALLGCFYLIYRVVTIQLEKQRQNVLQDAGINTLFIQFLPPLVITGLNIIMPIIFSGLVKFEMYNTRTQVNIALFRIVFLRLASVFVLVSSLHQQITCEPKDSCRAGLGESCRSPICWETYVGQQLYKLVITDFLVYVCMFLGYDLPRDFIVQRCKCKVVEAVGRQVFDLPSQVLSLVYSQTLCWLGLFYSPLLAGISVLKFLIIFYMKKVVVLKHCVPAPVLYKASRNNSIFMMILMISLFVVTIIHGYSLTSIEPSPGCSPFRQYSFMIHAISDAIDDWSPNLVEFMKYLFSGFFFVPAFLLLSITIYYYWTVVAAHKQMTKVLKAQIAVEGRDKQFLLNRLAEAARQATN